MTCTRCGQALESMESHFTAEPLPGYCIATRLEHARLDSGNGFGLVVRTVLVKHAASSANRK